MQLLVGIFWPSMMKLRSQYVPEGIRATTLNLFRVPLNLFVCLVLYNVRCPSPVLLLSMMLSPAISPAADVILTQLQGLAFQNDRYRSVLPGRIERTERRACYP